LTSSADRPRIATPPDAVIFDMDGVLIDSNPFHLRIWGEFLTLHGVPFDPDKLGAQIFGQRDDYALRMFFGAGISDEQSRRWSEELEHNFRESFRAHARPLPGAAELVRECRAQDVPLAVASSAMRKNVDFVVEALRLKPFFQVIVSGDEVSHPKPDPEIYLAAAAQLGAEPSRCVAFEDSPVGIEAVVRAGMKCVAIASTFAVDELRSGTGAHAVVRSFEELNLGRLRGLFAVPSK
jgi:beta-phosphoglucomutase